jgi:hypothetical protein
VRAGAIGRSPAAEPGGQRRGRVGGDRRFAASPLRDATPGWTAVAYRRDHLPALVAFLAATRRPAVEKGALDLAHYEWKLHGGDVDGVGALALDGAGAIVGACVASLRPWDVFGRRVMAAELGDGVTAPGYRRQGVFRRLAAMTTEQARAAGAELVYGTPNRGSAGGLLAMGFRPPASLGMRAWVRLRPTLRSAARARAGSTGSPLRRPAVPSRSVAGWSWRPGDWADSDLDAVWQSARARFDVVRARDGEAQRQHFEASGRLPYRLVLARQAERTCGYAVLAPARLRGLQAVLVADWLFDAGVDGRAALSALLAALDPADLGCDLVALWLAHGRPSELADGPSPPELLRLGYLPAKRVALLVDPAREGWRALRAGVRWHITMADSDNV